MAFIEKILKLNEFHDLFSKCMFMTLFHYMKFHRNRKIGVAALLILRTVIRTRISS